ncbi:roadblock/LC7 domain-containing protein [Streptomyces millisiae]|uniref:Roadblock/LC7 domain-containing protein n=1 Tax=Streptomyces millisiae TaxID=3075542 RepID=A0ABU2LKC5_9ACTN|nr:roadblock/LC7 domain-containing protein [Streptomyces sp. DSM 44918]MDT0318036.1 roadblock/LC7 domain-containing protein [Streptomyces sp. DSM 44918]
MTQMPNQATDLNWMLDDLVRRVPRTRHVLVLSADGLVIAHSRDLGREDAEHISAVASGFQSLARGFGHRFAGGHVRQTIVELENLFLFVTGAGQGACLAILGEDDIDVGLVAYEMNLLVKRVGEYLAAAPRHAAAVSPTSP